MEFSVEQHDKAAVVGVTGSVDALTAGEVTDFLSKQLDAGSTFLVLDLSKVSYISSAGLRTILATLKEARTRGGDLRLAAIQTNVQKVLQMSGFTSILKTYTDVETAVSSFK
jgi:anti-sigma B factor antagonist